MMAVLIDISVTAYHIYMNTYIVCGCICVHILTNRHVLFTYVIHIYYMNSCIHMCIYTYLNIYYKLFNYFQLSFHNLYI